MSYLVLARRMRPRRFDDLIGQEINSEILKNAVHTNRVAHAFLFTGSRGVGKTSAARILARAINCLNPENGNPCNNCINCIDINNNASPDIFEIDAASNRGIDNIRELRGNVNYVPSRCRYKVYIIDEAHMLTLESFNALLKTLEEPPEFVKFIFATTDPHKIPQTIISRCQRYDFLRISVKKISDYLEQIIKNEKLLISRKSLEMIAHHSFGGMRDALTAIDQILSVAEEEVSDEKVSQILGILDHESRFSLIEALINKKNNLALINFQKLQERGYDINDILSDLLNTIKTVSIVKSVGTDTDLFQDIVSDDLEVFQKLAKSVKIDELQQIFQILLQLEERLKVSAHSKICFEMTILQITSVDSIIGIDEIINEIKNLKNLEISKKKTVSNKYVLKKNLETKTNEDEKYESYSFEENEESDKSKQIDIVSEKKFDIQHSSSQENGVNGNSSENNLYSNKKKDSSLASYETSQDLKLSENKKIKSFNLELNDEEINDHKNSLSEQKKPPEEWFKFSEEAQKISPKLASFIRNAIPQRFSESQINLIFKVGNYSSLIDQNSIEKLEKIATDLSGHTIKIIINGNKSNSSKQTIAEYQEFMIEEAKKEKKEKAIESPQVKKVLSVFKNSKINEIKLPDE